MRTLCLPLTLFVVSTCLAGCQSATPGKDYVAADRHTYSDFAPVVDRDVAAGHQDTRYAYTAWRLRLEAAEKNLGLTPAATQP